MEIKVNKWSSKEKVAFQEAFRRTKKVGKKSDICKVVEGITSFLGFFFTNLLDAWETIG